MLRVVSAALRGIAAKTTSTANATNYIASRCDPVLNFVQQRGFGALSIAVQNWTAVRCTQHKLLNHATTENRLALPAEPINVPVRTAIKFSMKKGKQKSVKTVLTRFYRLNWGIWIRTKAGRHNKLWTKSSARKKRLREHVFCNATQSTLLDRMVTKYWKRRRFYVDDPYEPYHSREEFMITRRKPLP